MLPSAAHRKSPSRFPMCRPKTWKPHGATHRGKTEAARSPDRWRLLSHLIQSEAADCEYRDAVGSIYAVVPPRISPQHVRVEFTTAHEHHVVIDDIAVPQSPQLHACDCRNRSRQTGTQH